MGRMSAALARLAGITLPGTPRRSVSTTRSSAAPDAHKVVRFGPLSPFASAPWQDAQLSAKSRAPGRGAGACASAARRPTMIRTVIGTREYTAPRKPLVAQAFRPAERPSGRPEGLRDVDSERPRPER